MTLMDSERARSIPIQLISLKIKHLALLNTVALLLLSALDIAVPD